MTSSDSSQSLVFPDQLHFLIFVCALFCKYFEGFESKDISFMASDPIADKDLIHLFLLDTGVKCPGHFGRALCSPLNLLLLHLIPLISKGFSF